MPAVRSCTVIPPTAMYVAYLRIIIIIYTCVLFSYINRTPRISIFCADDGDLASSFELCTCCWRIPNRCCGLIHLNLNIYAQAHAQQNVPSITQCDGRIFDVKYGNLIRYLLLPPIPTRILQCLSGQFFVEQRSFSDD